MEDSPEMTINYLRARLLSERSVSKTAKQRADELSKRVVELEEQLKNVCLQRKKAEKAAADVLAILENNGITDVSEAYDSSSDQEGTLCESNVGNNSVEDEEEASASLKARRNDVAAFSGSELESPALNGRSLSWKSNKNSPHSLEKKRSLDSSRRRRGSFTSTGSSSSRAGKSCRQIRRRETRSVVEEFQMDAGVLDNQGNEVARCSKCCPNSAEIRPEILREGSENLEGSDLVEDPVSGVLENQRIAYSNYSNGHGGNTDMERALEQQAQLIGRHESEEKAQREWEEKYRENNSCTPDSCDPGTHSDVTEERDEIKPPPPPLSNTGTLTTSQNHEAESGFGKETQNPNGFQQDQKSSTMTTSESPAPEFAFSMSNGNNHNQEGPDSRDTHGTHSAHFSPRLGPNSSREGESSNTTNELALMPHVPSNNLGSVLEALQRAKLSLKQNLNKPPLIEGGASGVNAIQPSVPTGDRLDIPGLFRVPTDFQFNATTQSNNSQLNLTNYSPEPASDRFLFNPYMDSRDRFLTVPSFPYTEIKSGVPTRMRPVFEPSFHVGPPNSGRLTYPDPRSSAGLPYGKYTYRTQSSPPELMPTIPPENVLTRSLPSREVGMPSMNQFSFYDHNTRPNMYR